MRRFLHLQEARGIPDLRREIAADLELRLVDLRIAVERGDEREREAERVGGVGVDQLKRVERVAERLRHLASLRVAHDAVDHDVLERRLLHEVDAGHHHAGHPEEDDVLRRHEVRGRIVEAEVVGLLWPAHRGERPQPRAEPGVEHVGILLEVGGGQVRVAGLGFRHLQRSLGGLGNKHLFTIPYSLFTWIPAHVVSGNPMSPPELARDAPVLDVVHPVEVDLAPAVRHEAHLAGFHRLDGGLGERLHLHEPLLGEAALHDLVATIAVSHLVVDVLDVVEEAAGFEIGNDRLAALPAVHAAVLRAGEFVHRAVIVHDVDFGEIVALAHEEVVRVVRGRDFHDARAKLAVHVVVGDHGDLAPGERQDHGLAEKVRVALVLRVDRDRRIAGERFRTRGGDHHVVLVRLARSALLAPHHGILDVPEVPVVRLVLHLVVREGRAAAWTPVHDVVALVDEALVVELREHLRDRPGAALVEREAFALPVGGVTEHALLVHDRAAVLLLPLPHARDERLAPEVLTTLALLLEGLLHYVLRGDAGVVRAGQPEGVEAGHTTPPHEDILDRLVERVPHVQDAGYVRRGYDHRIGDAALGRLRVKVTVILPDRVPFGLGGLGVVSFVHHFLLCFFFREINRSTHFVAFPADPNIMETAVAMFLISSFVTRNAKRAPSLSIQLAPAIALFAPVGGREERSA